MQIKISHKYLNSMLLFYFEHVPEINQNLLKEKTKEKETAKNQLVKNFNSSIIKH